MESQAVEKSDYTPLAGRDCVIFPDYDLAGKKASNDLVKRLRASGACSVKVLDIEKLALTPGWQGEDGHRTAILNDGEPLAVGDDAADLVSRGWEASHLALLLKRENIFLSPDSERTKPTCKPDEQQAETVQRGFELFDDGLYFLEPTKDGRLRRRKISARLEVLALARDVDSREWGTLVRFSDPDSKVKRWLFLPAVLMVMAWKLQVACYPKG